MKKTFCILILVLLSGMSAVNAQIASNKWAVGAHFGVMEINGDFTKQFYSFTQGWAVAASVARYVNPSFDLMGHFFYDRVHGHDIGASKMPTWMIFNADMFNLNMLAKYKFNNGYILKEKARLAPFILGGVGGNLSATNGTGEHGALDWKKILMPSVYAGLGLSLRITKAVSLVVQSSLLYPFTDRIDGMSGDVSKISKPGKDKFLENSAGLYFTLGKIIPEDTDGDGVPDKNDKCPDTPTGVKVDAFGCPVDTDQDGVADYLDKCPDTPTGVKVDAFGCPVDTDQDGVADYQDECPDVFGLAALKGCPDSDGDGVPDKDDRCPATPKGQKVDAFGCTIDTDNDGIPDSEDACPEVAGIPELNGCPPDVKYIAEKYSISMAPLLFDFDSNALKTGEIAALDKIVQALKEHRDLGIQLDGHADWVGAEDYNLKLSLKRAHAARSYLLKMGVSENQIKVAGYGESKPIRDNRTAEGRKFNRRVEYKLLELGK